MKGNSMNKKWIFLILALVLIFIGNNLPVYGLDKMKTPVYKHCKTVFTGERCSSCDKSIDRVGVFRNEGQLLRFHDVFKNYEDYRTYMKQGKVRNIAAVPVILAGVAALAAFFYCCYKDKHKMSRIV